MKRVLDKIRQMIKQGYVSKPTDDSEAYPRAQVTHNGKPTDVTRLSPYGLDSNPPSGSMAVLFNSQAQEAVKFGIISDMLNRKKSLKEGEVALYNSQTGSYMLLSEDDSIELLSAGGAQLKLKADGLIAAANTQESLHQLVSDLIDAVIAATTFGSPTQQQMDPATVAALTAIKTRFATLLGSV